jgi:cyclase
MRRDEEEPMHFETIGPNVHLFVGDTYQSNATAFVADEGVLLVDSLASRGDAEALRAAIESEIGKPVRFVVCTHYFSDHLAGLRLFPEAWIVAHRDYAATFDAERFRSEEEIAHFVEPDILVSDAIRFAWGEHTLDVFHNPGHTPSTLNVDAPEADLLHVGDTIVGNMVYFAYTTPELLEAALVRAEGRGRRRILSSHMGLRGPEAIASALFYVASLRARVRAAARYPDAGDRVRSIELQSCLPAGVEGSAFEEIYHARNLESILTRGLFGQNRDQTSHA